MENLKCPYLEAVLFGLEPYFCPNLFKTYSIPFKLKLGDSTSCWGKHFCLWADSEVCAFGLLCILVWHGTSSLKVPKVQQTFDLQEKRELLQNDMRIADIYIYTDTVYMRCSFPSCSNYTLKIIHWHITCFDMWHVLIHFMKHHETTSSGQCMEHLWFVHRCLAVKTGGVRPEKVWILQVLLPVCGLKFEACLFLQ